MERIAKAMETQIFYEYGFRMGHMTEKVPDPHPEVEESVDYASDEETVREILREMRDRKKEEAE